MRLTKRFGPSTLEQHMKKGEKVETPNEESKTFLDERQDAEKKAVDFFASRKAQSEKYPNVPPVEVKEVHKDLFTDHDKVIDGASKILKARVNYLVGKGGYEISLNEFRSRKSHRDTVDDSEITDQALIAFAVKFALPGHKKFRTARLVVAYNDKADERYNVEDTFYDTNDTEFVLTSSNLEKFLKNSEQEIMADKETPLVYYNPELQNYEIVETPEDTEKVVARLTASGYKVDKEWIDACYDPKLFGRRCYVAQVRLGKADELKKLAALTDDEWVGRTDEKSYKQKDGEWNDRTLESGQGASYKAPDLKKPDNWTDRALESAGHGNYGNPYNSEKKLLSVDSAKKDTKRREAVKKALAERQDVEKDSLSALDKLENIFKKD